MKILIILICCLVVHVIGGFVCLRFLIKNGTMENAAKYGDGIRFANPFDVVVQSFLLWEGLLIIYLHEKLEDTINKKYSYKEN